jgi:integrase
MERVQPIRNPKDIEKMKAILRRQSLRNYMLFRVGCNTALRPGDLVGLTVGKVRDERGDIREHITVRQEKTGKSARFKLPESVRNELAEYVVGTEDDAPLFPSREGGGAQPLSTIQAWRIISEAAEKAGVKDNIGAHSLRKTWAYHAFRKTGNISVVQHKLCHSSEKDTKVYICTDDDEAEAVLGDFEL